MIRAIISVLPSGKLKGLSVAMRNVSGAVMSTSDVKNIATQNLAIAHLFNENYDRTISLLSSQGSDPHIAYWLGLSYAVKEDEANAKFYFQRAVDGGVDVEQEVYDYLYSY